MSLTPFNNYFLKKPLFASFARGLPRAGGLESFFLGGQLLPNDGQAL
jgi:hypothetical protein